jgi:uncharacterized membrane protein
MFSKKAVWALIVLLVLESAALVAVPSRIPRPARMVSAGIVLAAAVSLWLILRQREKS